MSRDASDAAGRDRGACGRCAAALGLWWAETALPSAAAVEADIDAELQGHLAMLQDELRAAGLDEEAAHAEAQRRFGDARAVFRACRHIRLRQRIMIRRINLAALVLMAAAAVFFALQARSTRLQSRLVIEDLQAELAHARERLSAQEQSAADGVLGSLVADAASARQLQPELEEAGRARGAAVAPAVPDPGDVLAQLNAAWPLSRATSIASRLAELAADELLRLLRTIWGRIDSEDVRQLLLQPLLAKHPQLALQLLHLGATDDAEAVRRFALAKLSDYAFVDFVADPEAYAAWQARFGELPAGEAIRASGVEWLARVSTLAGDALCRELEHAGRWKGPLGVGSTLGVDLLTVLREAGLQELLERAVATQDGKLCATAWGWAAMGAVDAAFLRRHAAPVLRDPAAAGSEVTQAVYRALGSQRAEWSNALVREAMATTPVPDPTSGGGPIWAQAQALASGGDASAIPLMIGMIVAHPGYQTEYGIGHMGLRPLTGVPYDESHDGQWWLEWWEKNRHRLPAHVRSLPIPSVPTRR